MDEVTHDAFIVPADIYDAMVQVILSQPAGEVIALLDAMRQRVQPSDVGAPLMAVADEG